MAAKINIEYELAPGVFTKLDPALKKMLGLPARPTRLPYQPRGQRRGCGKKRGKYTPQHKPRPPRTGDMISHYL